MVHPQTSWLLATACYKLDSGVAESHITCTGAGREKTCALLAGGGKACRMVLISQILRAGWPGGSESHFAGVGVAGASHITYAWVGQGMGASHTTVVKYGGAGISLPQIYGANCLTRIPWGYVFCAVSA